MFILFCTDASAIIQERNARVASSVPAPLPGPSISLSLPPAPAPAPAPLSAEDQALQEAQEEYQKLVSGMEGNNTVCNVTCHGMP